MKNISEMTQSELAGFICTHLAQAGIETVLSGGACVEYYTRSKYTSMDIDLVNMYFARREKIAVIMTGLGFTDTGKHFAHPDTRYLVEVPPGPLGVGEEQPREISEVRTQTGLLKLLSPTDCVKDRLIQHYHWQDPQCLEQAVLVAQNNPVDLKELRRWSIVEGKLDTFKSIQTRLRPNPR